MVLTETSELLYAEKIAINLFVFSIEKIPENQWESIFMNYEKLLARLSVLSVL